MHQFHGCAWRGSCKTHLNACVPAWWSTRPSNCIRGTPFDFCSSSKCFFRFFMPVSLLLLPQRGDLVLVPPQEVIGQQPGNFRKNYKKVCSIGYLCSCRVFLQNLPALLHQSSLVHNLKWTPCACVWHLKSCSSQWLSISSFYPCSVQNRRVLTASCSVGSHFLWCTITGIEHKASIHFELAFQENNAFLAPCCLKWPITWTRLSCCHIFVDGHLYCLCCCLTTWP